VVTELLTDVEELDTTWEIMAIVELGISAEAIDDEELISGDAVGAMEVGVAEEVLLSLIDVEATAVVDSEGDGLLEEGGEMHC